MNTEYQHTLFRAHTTGLARQTDPDTSHDAAQSVDATKLMDKIYWMMVAYGENGCIADDVVRDMPEVASGWNTITPRFRQMVDRGMIECTGEKRKGDSSRMQLVRRALPQPFVPRLRDPKLTALAKAKARIKELEAQLEAVKEARDEYFANPWIYVSRNEVYARISKAIGEGK